MLWLAPLILAVSASAAPRAGWERAAIVSPSAEAAGGWVPILAESPEGFRRARVQVTLDGNEWEDPLAVVRPSDKPRIVEYLGYLDLESLAEGPHTLRVVFQGPNGRRGQAERQFSVVRSGYPVRVKVRDAAGRPVAVRVFAVRQGLPVVLASFEGLDPKHRDDDQYSVLAVDGEALLHLPRGASELFATRGLRDSVDTRRVTVNGPLELTLRVDPVVRTPGEVAADLHVHSAHSSDTYLPKTARLHSLAVSGLDVVVTTDHGVHWNPVTDGASVAGTSQDFVAGFEHAMNVEGKNDVGHVVAFPVAARLDLDRGERDRTSALIERIRGHADDDPFDGVDDVLVQLVHPRGIQYKPGGIVQGTADALWSALGFNRQVAVAPGGPNAWMIRPDPATEATALDFDAVEVVNRSSWSLYRTVRHDWYALWAQGFTLTATGNSDAHTLNAEQVGFPLNLVAVSSGADTGGLVDAVQEGRSSVTTGPVVHLEVEREGRSALGPRARGAAAGERQRGGAGGAAGR